VDVDELRPCAGLGDGFCGRNESVRHGNDRISRLHAGGDQGEPQGVRAAPHADAIVHSAKLCKFPFEVFHHRSADESRSLQSASEDRHQFLFYFEVGCDEVYERNFTVAGHFATLSSGTINRRTRAGFPATMALSGTSRVTTLPAPTMAFCPMTTFERLVAPDPIEASIVTNA